MTDDSSKQIDRVKDYYRRSDARESSEDLFVTDFEFYFPKFGVGRGMADMQKCFSAMGRSVVSELRHLRDDLLFIEHGRYVAVEGKTEGVGHNGVEWRGGTTPGGRFCSVFEFNDDGLIQRMNIYLDPDYTSQDKAAFVWSDRTDNKW